MSLPDISSTEIAPTKNSAPNKIININHARGLHHYQKQLGKDAQEELGGTTILGQALADSKIVVKNGNNILGILRNRSTSPTIGSIQKKSMLRRDG